MKIALCLHGKFNNRLSKSSGIDGSNYIKEVLLGKYPNIDVFIHSWDLEFKKKIENFYRDFLKKSLFEKQLDFKEIAKNYEIDDAKFNPPNAQSFRTCANSLSFFYSRKRVIQLKSEFENENGFKYDAVIVSRFDLGQIDKYNGSHPYNVSEINFDPNFDMGYIYSAMWDQLNCGYADQWFYSSSANINKIAEIYEKSLEYFAGRRNYINALQNWPESNLNDEFSNEVFKSDDFKSKNFYQYLTENAINNHAMYKWFFIDSNLHSISKFV
ncbi:MAG: hypothetical protein ACJAW3_000984 [Lentimonas sp.]|jgi:hypothetical protein